MSLYTNARTFDGKQCHITQIGGIDLYFSYNTLIAVAGYGKALQDDRVYSRTTSRHRVDMGCARFPKADSEAVAQLLVELLHNQLVDENLDMLRKAATDPKAEPEPEPKTELTAPEHLHIGAYIITLLPEPVGQGYQKYVALCDTRTGEGGTFDADAVGTCVTDALDTFFMETF